MTLEEFNEIHPRPDNCGIDSLYKFYKIDFEKKEHLQHLFLEKKLYHSSPSQFNDPLECRPHFNVPKDQKVKEMLDHLINRAKEEAQNRIDAKTTKKYILKRYKGNLKVLQEDIIENSRKAYADLRICSFTAENKKNLLLWSHYADSHKGFCVEFDATKMPMKLAYKVDYSPKYPEITYPIPYDDTAFRPALVKSKDWKYENEFRIIYFPESRVLPPNDRKSSLCLNGDEIKNVYFGSQIGPNKKQLILDLVKEGDFTPGIWDTKLAQSNFDLEFTRAELI